MMGSWWPVANLAMLGEVPAWAFWVVALAVCGHALWVALTHVFGMRWPGLVSSLACVFGGWLALLVLWNDVPLDQVVSPVPELTWLALGEPAELRISVCFHGHRLCGGLMLWWLPMLGLVILHELVLPRPVLEQGVNFLGVVSAFGLASVFLLAFAGDLWVLLVIWLLMPVLAVGLIWGGQHRDGIPFAPRDLLKFLIPMLLTDLGLLLSVMVLGSGLSAARVAATLNHESLLSMFADNPAALDTVAMGLWLSVSGRILLPILSLGNEMRHDRFFRSAMWHQVLLGVCPSAVLLLKFHEVIWMTSLTESFVLLWGVLGLLAALFAACSDNERVSIGWATTWGASAALCGIMTGTRTGVVAGLLILASWLTMLAVSGASEEQQQAGWRGRIWPWFVLVILASGLCGLTGLVQELSKEGQHVAEWVLILGAGFSLFAWSCHLAQRERMRLSLTGTSRGGAFLELMFIAWGLGIGVLLCERAWWSSSQGLMLMTGTMTWENLTSAYLTSGLTSGVSLRTTGIGVFGAVAGLWVGRMKAGTAFGRLAGGSLKKLGQQSLYTSEGHFLVSLTMRGLAQLSRMFDWIVLGMAFGRIPQRSTGLIQSELNTLLTHPVPWIVLTWVFGVSLVLVILLISH